MPRSQDRLQPMKRSDVHPDVIGALEPEEEVYWYEEPRRKAILPGVLVVIALFLGILWQEGYLDDPAELVEGASTATLVLTMLIPIVLVGGFVAVGYYRRDASVYVLTSQRVMRLFKGRIAQQATPEKLQLRGSPRRGSVPWHNIDYPPDSESRGRYGFARVRDGIAIRGLLEAWQKATVGQADQDALAASESFRRRFNTSASETESGGDAATDGLSVDTRGSDPIQRIRHPEHGFTIEAPAEWDVLVGQEYDGPLRFLGVTIVKRVLRPAELRPYRADDPVSWNRLVIRGGPSVGMTLKVNPGRMYQEDEVLADGIGERLGVAVQSIERDIDVAGFRGFAVVRELPAGTNLIGFGNLPLAVFSRQWWLTHDDLNLEIQGLAPRDSATLQDTIDLMVASLRP